MGKAKHGGNRSTQQQRRDQSSRDKNPEHPGGRAAIENHERQLKENAVRDPGCGPQERAAAPHAQPWRAARPAPFTGRRR